MNVLFANMDTIVGGGSAIFLTWFMTRHTMGKWPWQWGKWGRFDKIGLGK